MLPFKLLIIDNNQNLHTMRNIMPAQTPPISLSTLTALQMLGKQIKAQRKLLGVGSVLAADAAGVSRVTLHRVEKGEPSVTMGAYLNVAKAVGLELKLFDLGDMGNRRMPDEALVDPTLVQEPFSEGIKLKLYPQLRDISWQLSDDAILSPEETLACYERNWRHVDLEAMEPTERQLVNALKVNYGKGFLLASAGLKV